MSDKSRLAATLAVFLVSGASALVYEVVWIRSLEILFGSSTSAVATVLAVYMGGLALGAAYLSRVCDRWQVHPLLLYAGLEAGIALWALLLPFLFPIVDNLYVAHYSADGPSTRGIVLRFATTVLFLLVPTMLMGATFPVMVKGLTGSFPKKQWQNLISSLYGVNTFGAVCGVFLAGFVLLRSWGLSQTNMTAVVLNLVAAATALALWRAAPRYAPPQLADKPAAKQASTASFPRWAVIAVAFTTGFAALSCEVVWTRLLKLIFAGTTFSVSIMLMSFLAGIGAGSMLASRWKEKATTRIPVLLMAFGVLAAVAVPLIFKSMDIWRFIMKSLISDASGATWTQAVAGRFLLSALIMFLPALMSGAIFPQLVTLVSRRAGADVGMARTVGSVFALNTAGAVCGSLATGFLLIPWLGTRATVFLSAILLTGLGAALLARSVRPMSARFAIPVGTAILVLFFSVRAYSGEHYIGKLKSRDDTRILHFEEGIGASVVVVQDGPTGRKRLYTNGSFAVGTSFESLQTVNFLGQLPCLYADQTDEALVIGMGMGVTLASVASHPFRAITCVEIVPGVYDAARVFSEFNGGVLEDERVHTVVEDGYSYLKGTGRTYDVITCDPIHPAFGSPTLYTQEFYASCKEHLNPGGAIAQYIPTHQLSEDDFRTLVRTFRSVFPNSILYMSLPHGVLVARSESTVLDLGELGVLFAGGQQAPRDATSPAALFEGVGIYSPAKLISTIALDSAGLQQIGGDGPINTLNHTRLEFSEGRSYGRDTRVENLALIMSRPPNVESLIVQKTDAWPDGLAARLQRLVVGRKHLLQGLYSLINENQEEAINEMRIADLALSGDAEVLAIAGEEVLAVGHLRHGRAALQRHGSLAAQATADNAAERAELLQVTRTSLDRLRQLIPDHPEVQALLSDLNAATGEGR